MSLSEREEDIEEADEKLQGAQKESPEDSVLNLIKGLRDESQQIADLKDTERAFASNVILESSQADRAARKVLSDNPILPEQS